MTDNRIACRFWPKDKFGKVFREDEKGDGSVPEEQAEDPRDDPEGDLFWESTEPAQSILDVLAANDPEIPEGLMETEDGVIPVELSGQDETEITATEAVDTDEVHQSDNSDAIQEPMDVEHQPQDGKQVDRFL